MTTIRPTAAPGPEPATWLISGAGGGIGHALVETVLTEAPSSRILATHRHAVCSNHPSIEWLQLDLEQPDAIADFARTLPTDLNQLDYFVCCSGMLSDGANTPEKRLGHLDTAHMQRSYQINAAGPLALFAAVADRIAAGRSPVAAFLSAQVGSIGDNASGGWYSYRMAKAALNMGVKCLAIETARWRTPPVVMAIHPGTTRSQLSNPFTRRRQPPPRSADATAQRIYHLMRHANADQNGRFLTADGDSLPW